NGISSASCDTKCGRSGLGPTKLISPFKMFQNCGISSTRILRMMRPTRVVRVSFLLATPDLTLQRQRASIETWPVQKRARSCRPVPLVDDRTLRLQLDQHSRDQNDRQRKYCANQ